MLSTWFFTKLKGKCVGIDPSGNKYFVERPLFAKRLKAPERRWVVYQGALEASKVPATWHGWLHGTTNKIPEEEPATHSWEKKHQPNLTGTTYAYQPKTRGSQGTEDLLYYKSWKSSKLHDNVSKK